ncbi:MAG: transcriptional repressor LexA [Phycisphaerae bacterium]|nr:transcriptional repressor LexA [Phycisphaerae bacterium]
MRNVYKTKKTGKSVKEINTILTPRQVQILRYLSDYRDSNGCSPTLKEIADYLGVTKVTVFEHVEALIAKGALHRAACKVRSLTLDPSVKLARRKRGTPKPVIGSPRIEGPAGRGGRYPLAGSIAAGTPIEAIETPDTLDLSTMFETSTGTFALSVRGESMIDEHICDGDYVLIEKCNQARDGQIVVAILKNGEATLKKIYKGKKMFRLEGANPNFKPIYAKHVDIQGVVVGVLRRF